MSEQAPEAVRPQRRGGGNVFTQKIGPLPMWAWVGIALAAFIGWRIYANRQSASSTSTTASGSTAADQVPEFINQTYTTVNPPSSNPPPNGGPPGGGGGGGNLVTVPDVVGEMAETGQDILGDAGLTSSGVEPFPKGTPKGSIRIITSQEPKPGSHVKKGSAVKLSDRVLPAPKKKASTGGGARNSHTPGGSVGGPRPGRLPGGGVRG